MKQFLIIVFLMALLPVKAQTKTNSYDIGVSGINVGTLVASKIVDGAKTTYIIDSKSSVRLLGVTTVSTSVVAIFRNGILESSTYTSEKDGNPYDSSVITESNGVYTINRKGKKSIETTAIRNITAMLYFEKPEAGAIYFDILSGTNAPIESSKLDSFIYQSSGSGEKTTYTYQNNFLEKGVTDYTLFSFTYTAKK